MVSAHIPLAGWADALDQTRDVGGNRRLVKRLGRMDYGGLAELCRRLSF